MGKRTIFIIMAVLVCGYPSYAEEKAEEGKGVEVSLGGYQRVRHYFIEDVDISDPTGKILHSNTSYFQQRIRLEPTVRISENVKLIGQIDIFDDVIFGNNNAAVPALAGSPSSQGPDGSFTDRQFGVRAVNPKRFYADVLLPFGKLEFGRMPSNWGLGLLENDGNGFKNEWGDAHFGSTRDRILFATKPLGKEGPMILALGFDKLVTANANTLAPGSIDNNLDDVQQFFLVPVYQPQEKKVTVGAFAAYRTQDSTKTDIYAVSGYGDVEFEPVRLQLEAVWIGGSSEAFRTILINEGKNGRTDVNALNGVLRATYSYDPLKIIVEGGYASGMKNDAALPLNSTDKSSKITSYPFNPDYNVGLILFEELLARKTAEAVGTGTTIPYPEFRELIPTYGSVENAWYAAPLVKFDLTEAFGMKLGVLYAQSIEPLTDPNSRYESSVYGRNYDGGKPSRDLGWEIDYGLHFGLADNFDVGVQLGYFIPGKAFANRDGNKVNIFETLTRLTLTF